MDERRELEALKDDRARREFETNGFLSSVDSNHRTFFSSTSFLGEISTSTRTAFGVVVLQMRDSPDSQKEGDRTREIA